MSDSTSLQEPGVGPLTMPAPGRPGPVERVALVAPYDYAYRGGVNTHISSLAQAYQGMGMHVRVIAACSEMENPPELLINASSSTVAIHGSGSVAYVSLSARAYGRIREVLRREAFDVVHLHEPLTPTIPFFTLLQSQALNVGTFHAYRDSRFSFYQAAGALKPLMDKLDGRVAVSPAARDYVARFFPGEYRIIPNGINYEFFAAEDIPRVKRFADGRPNLLFVGRLDKRKGFKYLLEAYEQVKRACPEVRLLAVGGFDQDEASPFLEFAQERRLPDVHMLGHVTDEELRSYYATADIVCVPSTGFESFGYVLVEGMAAGKPVVASDIAGYRFVLQHGRQGLLVPPEDPGALAEALIRLLRQPDVRRAMGESGKERAAQFSWRRVARTLVDYYQELQHHRRKRADTWYRIG
ncbi:MAG: glycosyltransferase family 4 protein [Anaerolineae bacterium]|jgi:phosphatidylinositol alpha-mannosyltransferase